MSSNSQTKKDLTNKNGDITKLVEWATDEANSIEELEALFTEQGVSYTSGEELTGSYKLITGDEKQLFLKRIQGRTVFVVKWEFRMPDNGGEYVSAYIVVDGHGKFIINDGAKSGLYGQLSETYSKRIAANWEETRARTGVKAERGFNPNKPFWYDTRTNKAISRKDLDDVPAEFKKQAHPTWKLEF